MDEAVGCAAALTPPVRLPQACGVASTDVLSGGHFLPALRIRGLIAPRSVKSERACSYRTFSRPPRACVSLLRARAASCADRVRMLSRKTRVCQNLPGGACSHALARPVPVRAQRSVPSYASTPEPPPPSGEVFWSRSPCAPGARCLLALRRPNRFLRPERCSGPGQRARPALGASLCFDARTASSVRRGVPAGRPSAPRSVLP